MRDVSPSKPCILQSRTEVDTPPSLPCWNHSAGENVYPKLEEGHLGRIPGQSADARVQAEAFE